MTTVTVLACVVAAAHAPPIQVEGASQCPTPSQVADALMELLPQTEVAIPAVARVQAAGLDLQIELCTPSGEVLFSRRLTSSGTCADLATIAAVVIASWSAERNADVSLLQPGVPAPPRAPPVAPLSPRNPPGASTGAARAAREFDLSAGLGGWADGAGVVGSARLEAGLRGRRFGLRLGLWGETERSEIIESRSVSWRRYGLSLGPTFALVKPPLMVEVRADVFGGLTKVDGHDFDVDGHSTGIAAGLAAGLRLGKATGRLRPWLELGGRYWLADQEITVTKPQNRVARTSLPVAEARLLVGLGVVLSL
jgi:hypothetical protein